MKNIIITVIIFLGLVGFVFARGIGMRMDNRMDTGGGAGGSFGDEVLWDGSGDAILWDSSGDKVLWE